MMSQIIVVEFVSLDGVMQDPDGNEGLKYGGWAFRYGPEPVAGAARSAGVRHYLAAGTLEPGFRRSTRQWAERLDRAGLPCRHEEWTGGHDQVWWGRQLPAALGWLLREQGSRPVPRAAGGRRRPAPRRPG